MAAISLVASIAPAIVNLALVSVSLNEAKVAFNRMFEFVGIPSEKKEGDFSPGRVDSIQVKNISFRFPGRKRILDNISLAAFKDKMILLLAKAVGLVNRHFARSWREHMSWRQGKFY